MRKHLYPALNGCITDILEQIPAPNESRQELLRQVADYLSANPNSRNLLFVCTHNSRRSHLSQYWAAAAAAYYDVADVNSFSGGTEATAFHNNTIDALVACGFEIRLTEKHPTNPKYVVQLGGLIPKLSGFSKRIGENPNPTSDFCAIMVCSEADKGCPFVPGATVRVSLPFEDPKVSDGTKSQKKTYMQRSREIAREMLWIFEQVGK
jgi:arsenate reductase (thioredoxin)